MVKTRTNFGELLREARLRAGLTQEELSLRSDLGVRTVGDLERDRITRPHRRTVDALVVALGLEGPECDAFRMAARPARSSRPRPAATGQRSGGCRAAAWSLPADLGDFVGRQADLEGLLAWVGTVDDPAHRYRGPVIISGAPGVGKTCFAVRAGYRLAERFPDGQVFVDLRGLDPGRRDPHETLGVLLRNLDVPEAKLPPSVEQRAALFRALVRDRAMLFVLDDAADEAQVRPLMTGSDRTLVIVTSRRTLAGLDTGYRVQLGGFEPGESLALLGLIAGWHRVATQPGEANEVAQLCGHLPLMLRIAGNRLAVRPQWTIGDLASLLRDERCRLSRLVAGDLAARPALEKSYRQLSQAAQRLFRRLALAPGGVASVPVAALLMESDQDSAELVLEELVDASLLTPTSSACRYWLCDPLRLLARELLYAQEQLALVRRLFAHVTALRVGPAISSSHRSFSLPHRSSDLCDA